MYEVCTLRVFFCENCFEASGKDRNGILRSYAEQASGESRKAVSGVYGQIYITYPRTSHIEGLRLQPGDEDAFHGQGDVYVHTRMICEELIKSPDFYICSRREQIVLFLAAPLHDIGKTRTTRLQDGRWTFPHHSTAGRLMAREFLWKECGLCGTEESMQIREAICALVRYHMLPVHLPDQSLYDDTWGEVILMSGLSGIGKDIWIQNHMPDIPMISLDEIREELNIRPIDPQGAVIGKAQEFPIAAMRNNT